MKFVHGKGLTSKREIRVETLGGMIVPAARGRRRGERRHGPPVYSGAVETLDVDGDTVEVAIVSMGNPHAVQVVADVGYRAGRRPRDRRIERHRALSAAA